jgi:formylglycine-generating enzyme required for sulfatase activity
MDTLTYRWTDQGRTRNFGLVLVPGTHGEPYTFGEPPRSRSVQVRDFFIATVPITQAFWVHLLGPDSNPAVHRHPDLPVENVSWDSLTTPGGFIDRLNRSRVAGSLIEQSGRPLEFRLPSETEWEYAARGGSRWRDGYRYSGGNDIDAVAWYDRRHGDHTQPVGQKAPNQVGAFDMSGNVWEWCQDTFSRDVSDIPAEGTPYVGPGDERVLRGGCFHNWAEHCTVSKRYEIARTFSDGCIGVRVVLADPSCSSTSRSLDQSL